MWPTKKTSTDFFRMIICTFIVALCVNAKLCYITNFLIEVREKNFQTFCGEYFLQLFLS